MSFLITRKWYICEVTLIHCKLPFFPGISFLLSFNFIKYEKRKKKKWCVFVIIFLWKNFWIFIFVKRLIWYVFCFFFHFRRNWCVRFVTHVRKMLSSPNVSTSFVLIAWRRGTIHDKGNVPNVMLHSVITISTKCTCDMWAGVSDKKRTWHGSWIDLLSYIFWFHYLE